ncbi:amidohydrolase [Fodinicola acaciae]|uniref:amidohydrolase n=1 Tax=Fodinicola acaciae TaxID=2681555 RepID=UPI0013CFAF6C|nr:amidohydrolase [Fodinicola acaciae]
MPDLLLRRARVLRLAGPAGSVAEPADILVSDGRIRVIGDASAYATGAEQLDLDGRYILPGLWDRHVHFTQWAISRQRLDLTGAGSAADVVALVAARVAASDEPVVGYGFRDGLWPDRPHRDDLDRVAPHVPVFLAANDLHSGWCNSAALRIAGFAGHPTGLLRETDFMTALRSVPVSAKLDAAVRDAAEAAAARGVVGIVDLEFGANLDTWIQRQTPLLRVECGVYASQLDDAIERGVRTGDVLPETGGLVTMGPLKVITDGSLNTRTAYCHDPYADGGHGELIVPPDELVPLMRRAAAHGIDAAIHAIGDHANRLALDAFAAVGCRGSIEHAQLLAPADVGRFAELGVVASVQPQHAVDDRDVADRYWHGRTHRAFPYRDLLDAGAELVFGSDAPVASLDPWISAAAAVERRDDDRPAWHPEQEITVAEALAASTNRRRSIRVGDFADLVITDDNPLDGRLRGMPVHGTLLSGRWTYAPK